MVSFQFLKDSLDIRLRHALLSGYAPAGENIGRIVCEYFSVEEKLMNPPLKADAIILRTLAKS